jgi:acyl carrier protein
MTTTEIEELVIKITSAELNLDSGEVNANTVISGHTDTLVMKFEDEFDIVIPGNEQDFETVSDAVSCIDNIMNGQSIAGD